MLVADRRRARAAVAPRRAATALAFGGASLVFSAVPAAAAGLALYALLLLAMRQLGLAEAWQYVRALH